MRNIAKTSGRFGAAAGALATLAVALTPTTVSAEDVQRVSANTETVSTILCETDRVYLARDGWTPESADYDCAGLAAHDYALNNPGIGILIHVGQDFPNQYFETPQQFGQAVVNAFRQQYGVEAQFFLSQNDAPATGLNFLIGPHTFGADKDEQDMLVAEAQRAMPEAAGLLRLHWQERGIDISRLDLDDPQPTGG